MFSREVGCVDQNHIHSINKDTMSINYDKGISRRVVIGSSLQQLRTELIESGRVLQELLKAAYPGADAVLATVQEIHNLLHHERISSVWVSARVEVNNECRFVTNRKVHEVSMLFSLCLNCNMQLPNQSCRA
jgi:hypothetical protein